ncbi:hypothetical protein KEM48_005562 [Puccinia striiformis f. sp. tritici PST-130]|nr:hypothetical protein KEM48_005562 [Puccinia striiformis f. sp. tritici PST-130]
MDQGAYAMSTDGQEPPGGGKVHEILTSVHPSFNAASCKAITSRAHAGRMDNDVFITRKKASEQLESGYRMFQA